jgi:hypothetical protein
VTAQRGELLAKTVKLDPPVQVLQEERNAEAIPHLTDQIRQIDSLFASMIAAIPTLDFAALSEYSLQTEYGMTQLDNRQSRMNPNLIGSMIISADSMGLFQPWNGCTACFGFQPVSE